MDHKVTDKTMEEMCVWLSKLNSKEQKIQYIERCKINNRNLVGSEAIEKQLTTAISKVNLSKQDRYIALKFLKDEELFTKDVPQQVNRVESCYAEELSTIKPHKKIENRRKKPVTIYDSIYPGPITYTTRSNNEHIPTLAKSKSSSSSRNLNKKNSTLIASSSVEETTPPNLEQK